MRKVSKVILLNSKLQSEIELERNSTDNLPRDIFDLFKDILSICEMGIQLYHDSSNSEDDTFQIPLGFPTYAETHIKSSFGMIFVDCKFDRF